MAQIDKNTERYMIDEMKQEVEELKLETAELKQETAELKQEAEELKLESEKLRLEFIENARNLFINGVPFEIVRNSINMISEETLKEIYDSVIENKNK